VFTRGRALVATTVTLALAGFLPASASATEILGSVADAGGCSDNSAYVGPSVSTGPDYIADAAGVVTTYSMTADSSTLATIRLLVLQPGAGSTYTLLQEDAPRTQTVPGAVNTQTNVHLPIAAGQTIGVYVPTQMIGNGWCLDYTGNALDTYRDFSGEPPLNSPSSFTNHADPIRLNLAATVEPDADNDTFGDETQDTCLGTAGPYSGCPTTVTLDKVKQKGKKPKVQATVTVPGAGILKVGSPTDPALASAAGKGGSKSLKVVTQTLTAKTKQQVVLTLKLTKSAKRKLADKGKLKTQVKVTYTPGGGPSASQTKKAKLKS
jgi:hypothetical protein